jgi:hypothetical protein
VPHSSESARFDQANWSSSAKSERLISIGDSLGGFAGRALAATTRSINGLAPLATIATLYELSSAHLAQNA